MRLRSLQSSKHLELLDIVDQLRAQGLNEHVDLPQLIVCGDQSSGKSSLLAAISGVPFPKKDNLCTRFATEVILRRNDDLQDNDITVRITPSSARPSDDRLILESFARKLSSIDELPSTIDDAGRAMGLHQTGNAFSADILRLEVKGPGLPQLTIVDLPGLVHAENKFQSKADIALVNALVGEYMSQDRSIILAVVSAKNDYANQIVLTKTREVDPNGLRTLGIITKPDTLHPGSAGETAFLNLARNQDIKFSLGWHVVRNQDSNQVESDDRDALEREYFETSRLGRLDEGSRGIGSLRERLSEVLLQQIQRELPDLISEIATMVQNTRTRLTRMGPSRTTPLEKRLFVMDLGEKFRTLCFAACEGLYEAEFFQETEKKTPERRLRAVVQNANIEFASRMLTTPVRVHSKPNVAGAEVPTVLDRANEIVKSHRGKELPGTFNPILIGQLFQELSRTWSDLTGEHIGNIWLHARTTVVAILDEVAEPRVRDACVKEVVDPILEQTKNEVELRLKDYMQAWRRQPITYNHYLTETVQAIRADRNRRVLRAKLRQLFETYGRVSVTEIDQVLSALTIKSEPNMDMLAAQDLADYAEAYYKVALKRVIDEVAAHVIEPAIMSPLAGLLDSSKILRMSDELIDAIGGEPEERRAQRDILQARLGVLNRSSLICKVYADTITRPYLAPRSPVLADSEAALAKSRSSLEDAEDDSPVVIDAAPTPESPMDPPAPLEAAEEDVVVEVNPVPAAPQFAREEPALVEEDSLGLSITTTKNKKKKKGSGSTAGFGGTTEFGSTTGFGGASGVGSAGWDRFH